MYERPSIQSITSVKGLMTFAGGRRKKKGGGYNGGGYR